MSAQSAKSQQLVFADLATLEKLLDVGHSLITVRDLQSLLQKIVETAGSILGADVVVLYEYQEETGDVNVPPIFWGDVRHPKVLSARGYERPHRDSIVFKVLEIPQPFYAPDAAQDWAKVVGQSGSGGKSGNFVERESIVSSAAIRLTAENERVGVLFVNYRTPRAFGEEEKRIIEIFATQAAIAIRNARLFQLERERKQQAETLREVAQTINLALSPDKVVGLVLEKLSRVIEYDSASVQLFQGDRRTQIGGRGFPAAASPYGLDRNISQDALVSKIVEQRVPLVLSDVNDEASWIPTTATAHVKSWIGAPLVVKDQVIGLLTLDHRKAGYYTQASGAIVAAFADQVAAAIHNNAQAQALTKLNKLTQSLIYLGELRQAATNLLEQIAEGALDVLGADIIEFYEYWQNRKELAVRPVSKGKREGPQVPRPEIRQDDVILRLINEAESQKQPIYIEDAQTHNIFLSPFVDRPKDWPQERFVLRERIRSSAFVPLRTDRETVGFMFVSYRTPQKFLPEHKGLTELFADLAAIAIRNTRLMTDLERQARGHRILNAVGADLIGLLDEKAILGRVARAAADTLDCTHCTVFLMEKDGLVVGAAQGKWQQDFAPGRTFRVGQGIAGWVAQTGQPVLVLNSLQDQRFEPGWSQQGNPQSLVVVPIVIESATYGVISAEQDRTGAFDEHDQLLLQTLALQVSQAVRNARLYADLELQIKRHKALNQVGRELSAKLDAEAIYDAVAKAAVQTLDCTHCTIFVLEHNQLVPHASHGRGEGTLVTRRFAVGEGLAGWVAQEGQAILFRDAKKHEHFVSGKTRPHAERSIIVVPVKLGDQVVGVISADQDRINAFDERDLQMIETLALQAAIGIENARLFQQVQQRADALKLLQEVSGKISATLNLDETLPLILSGAMRLTGASSGIVRSLDESGQAIEHSFELPDDFKHPAPRLSNPNSMTRRTIDGGQPIVVPDVAQDDRVNPDIAAKGVKSMISLPLKLEEKAVGVLCLNGDRLNQFEENQSLLHTLADQAAIALHNARLYEQQQRKVQELEVLTEMSRGAISNLGVDQILDLVYTEMSKVIDLRNAQVQFAFYNEAQDEVTFPLAVEQDNGQEIDRVRWGRREHQYKRGGEDELVKTFMPRVRREPPGLTEYVIRTEQPILIVEDFDQATKAKGIKVWPTFGRLDRPTHSFLGVPMIVGGRVIGIISMRSLEQEHAFDRGHVELLATVANQAAVAIENARLYQEARSDVIAAKQLAILGTAMAALQHRINNTFNIIVPNMARLRRRVDLTDPSIVEILDIMERNARYTSEIIARIQEPLKEVTSQDVDVNAVLREVVGKVRELWTADSTHPLILAEMDLDDSIPLIQTPVGQIAEVFRNLVDNSYRAMKTGGQVRITSQLAGSTIYVRVQDTGPGIPPQIKQRLFAKPVASKETGGGAGLGLWLSRLMLQSLGGDVTIEKSDPAGSTMLVQLPTLAAAERQGRKEVRPRRSGY